MDITEFDRENIELIAKGRVDEVERRLLNNYEVAKRGTDRAQLLHATSSLAHFYTLPFKEDLGKAETYFRERLGVFSDASSAFELVLFCFYSLKDPTKTLHEATLLRSLADPDKSKDLRVFYSAIAVEGQANLALNQIQHAGDNVKQLLALAKKKPEQVPFGDELNFIKQLLDRRLFVETCQSLLGIGVTHVRSLQYKREMQRLLRR